MKSARVLITGGGSGGHVMPLVAVVQELLLLGKEQGIDFSVRYFGPADEYSKVIADNNIPIIPILAGKLRRYFSPQNFLDVPKFFIAIFQCLWKIFWFMPDVIFSKGGPGALPVVIAGWFYQIPILIHESDSVPGLTNVFSSWFARKAVLGFEEAKEKITSCPTEYVGNPVRKEILQALQYDQESAKKTLGFDPAKKLLLILGGSQGSTRLNEFVILSLPEIIKDGIQILHQTGEQNLMDTQKLSKVELGETSLKEQAETRYLPLGFLKEQYGLALRAADIVLSRAGAGTLAELSAFGKPSFLVPLPESANDHQRNNAYAYSKNGSAIVMEEANLLPNIFMSQLRSLMKDSARFESMKNSSVAQFKPDAARRIAEVLVRL